MFMKLNHILYIFYVLRVKTLHIPCVMRCSLQLKTPRVTSWNICVMKTRLRKCKTRTRLQTSYGHGFFLSVVQFLSNWLFHRTNAWNCVSHLLTRPCSLLLFSKYLQWTQSEMVHKQRINYHQQHSVVIHQYTLYISIHCTSVYIVH